MPIKDVWLRFDGRINRQVYWIQGVLALFGAYIVLGIIVGLLALAVEELALAVVFIGYLALLWPSIAIMVKRCHDRDKSGWFILIMFIPVIGSIWLLVELGFLQGTVGENRFGPDPLGGEAAAPMAEVENASDA